MKYFYLTLLVLYLNAIQASVFLDLKNNVLSVLKVPREDKEDLVIPKSRRVMRYFINNNLKDAKDLKRRKEDLNLPRSNLTERIDKNIGREYFHMDPVLNEIRRKKIRNFRRNKDDDEDGSTASELEMKSWRQEWDEYWMQKKFEALNSTKSRGDVVNMVAARPWGVPCGDPMQHDAPWGSCMLPAECDAEYRIYRGDSFCGRTAYVCCSVLLTSYDMYQGLDISFEGSSFSTDSNEKNTKGDSAKTNQRKRDAGKNARKKARDKRKSNIRKSIRKIIIEIRKILNRAFRNGTEQRKKKTKQLKKFIEHMKKQYRKDRKSVVDVHESELVKIDKSLQTKLDQIRDMNTAFMSNDTYRDIVVNGTVNKVKLAKLLRAHPELKKFFINHRRVGGGLVRLDKKDLTIDKLDEEDIHKDWLEKEELDTTEFDKEGPENRVPERINENLNKHKYDVEYGVLYF